MIGWRLTRCPSRTIVRDTPFASLFEFTAKDSISLVEKGKKAENT